MTATTNKPVNGTDEYGSSCGALRLLLIDLPVFFTSLAVIVPSIPVIHVPCRPNSSIFRVIDVFSSAMNALERNRGCSDHTLRLIHSG
jgi:hypothetical protein